MFHFRCPRLTGFTVRLHSACGPLMTRWTNRGMETTGDADQAALVGGVAKVGHGLAVQRGRDAVADAAHAGSTRAIARWTPSWCPAQDLSGRGQFPALNAKYSETIAGRVRRGEVYPSGPRIPTGQHTGEPLATHVRTYTTELRTIHSERYLGNCPASFASSASSRQTALARHRFEEIWEAWAVPTDSPRLPIPHPNHARRRQMRRSRDYISLHRWGRTTDRITNRSLVGNFTEAHID